MELVRISDVLADPGAKVNSNGEMSSSRDISSNVTHSGDLDAMQHIKYKTPDDVTLKQFFFCQFYNRIS